MKKLSNTETELKKELLIKKSVCIWSVVLLAQCYGASAITKMNGINETRRLYIIKRALDKILQENIG